ncbi:MAG TPA: hypothetical protein DEB39_13875 [Planctomycetaceae bacterium]|nr:hypothetical protein [Planctomycetaceae bacterium]
MSRGNCENGVGMLKAVEISRSRLSRGLPTDNDTAEGKQAVQPENGAGFGISRLLSGGRCSLRYHSGAIMMDDDG